MKLDKAKLKILVCAIVGTVITWFLNHEMGYGAIVANGLVGIVAAAILSPQLAGITYSASFVGMSSLKIIPHIYAALLGGFIVGVVLIATVEIYAGIGGKGGTTAAFSTLITKAILGFLVR